MKQVIVIFGPQESGKTRLAEALTIMAEPSRVTVCDPWDPAFFTVEEVEQSRRSVILVSQVVVTDLPEHWKVFTLRGGRVGR